jgi:excisionase family DNA binding protein
MNRWVIPRDSWVPPRDALPLLAALLADAERRVRRVTGKPAPAEFVEGLRALRALAADMPAVAEPAVAAWVDVGTAATMLGRSERRVRQMIAGGRLRADRDVGARRWRVAVEDVAALAEGSEASVSER